jgi:hypothetical protein
MFRVTHRPKHVEQLRNIGITNFTTRLPPEFGVVVGLCGHMIPRAMLVVAYATGRVSHARQVKSDDPDKKKYSGPPGWGLGVRLTP